MAFGIVTNPSLSNRTLAGPTVTSYDSGYEHSFDRYVDVKLLELDADNESKDVPATYAWTC